VVIDKIARVSDVRAGDLDGDGDLTWLLHSLVMMTAKPGGWRILELEIQKSYIAESLRSD